MTEPGRPALRLDRLGAVVFDTDGVLTDTASVHAAAWKRLFDGYLERRAGRSAEVDGVEADRLGLAGKPDPALFLEAARRLGVAPARAAVVEDALAGVEAGRRGRFGTVVAAADAVHYPGTYVAGVYNRLTSQVAGREVENEDLVNVANWLPLTFRPEGGPWLDLGELEVLGYRQELDLRRGVLTRLLRVRCPDGRVTRMTQRRFVHMADPHLAGLETTVVPENWSGALEVRAALDGRVTNAGVERYRAPGGGSGG